MAFVKLDCGIVDSSLWAENVYVRLTFLTMLALCDSDGTCPATAPGIARRANLPLTKVRAALKKLENPDPDDRSGVAEGRRIKRVPGGYLVVNYLAYRSRDHTSAERKRRQREREREVVTHVTRDNRDGHTSRSRSRSKERTDQPPPPTREGNPPPHAAPLPFVDKPECVSEIERLVALIADAEGKEPGTVLLELTTWEAAPTPLLSMNDTRLTNTRDEARVRLKIADGTATADERDWYARRPERLAFGRAKRQERGA